MKQKLVTVVGVVKAILVLKKKEVLIIKVEVVYMVVK